jgi:hypothetical protein
MKQINKTKKIYCIKKLKFEILKVKKVYKIKRYFDK